jgi:DNA-binding MarR family transcriptional regulator
MRAEHRFPFTQGSVLGRLDREGRKSIGDLAALERVRPQSMTQTIADLEADGLIERCADPSDGRRTLVELTERGLATLGEDRRHREGWLARTLADDLTPREQRLLADALPLLERLAEHD